MRGTVFRLLPFSTPSAGPCRDFAPYSCVAHTGSLKNQSNCMQTRQPGRTKERILYEPQEPLISSPNFFAFRLGLSVNFLNAR